MALVILRLIFVVVAGSVATSIFRNPGTLVEANAWYPWLVFLGVMTLAGGIIALDVYFPRKQIDVISSVYIGLLVGMLLTLCIAIAMEPLLIDYGKMVRHNVQLVLGMVICYTCISLLIQTKDDFRFIIPYVEFTKEVKGSKPYVLDTSIVIDGLPI